VPSCRGHPYMLLVAGMLTGAETWGSRRANDPGTEDEGGVPRGDEAGGPIVITDSTATACMRLLGAASASSRTSHHEGNRERRERRRLLLDLLVDRKCGIVLGPASDHVS